MKKNVPSIVDEADEFDEAERETFIGLRCLIADSMLDSTVIKHVQDTQSKQEHCCLLNSKTQDTD